jgi:hypothetical protein
LGDIHITPELSPMDFAGRFETHLGDRRYAFDPRNNAPRASRVLIAGDRDAVTLPWPAQSNPTHHKASSSGATKSTQPIVAPSGGPFTLGLAADLHLFAVV